MKAMSPVKRICFCAVCVALCYVLPLAFHAVGAGNVFAPMHIPVLLCAMICGWGCGLLCAIAGPLLSYVLSGMPAAPVLIYMLPELAVYGVVTAVLLRYIRVGSTYADLYLALLPSMILGRIVGGIATALFYLVTAKAYSIAMWVTTFFITSLPGIILQLLVLPSLVFVLMKVRLIPERYPK